MKKEYKKIPIISGHDVPVFLNEVYCDDTNLGYYETMVRAPDGAKRGTIFYFKGSGIPDDGLIDDNDKVISEAVKNGYEIITTSYAPRIAITNDPLFSRTAGGNNNYNPMRWAIHHSFVVWNTLTYFADRKNKLLLGQSIGSMYCLAFLSGLSNYLRKSVSFPDLKGAFLAAPATGGRGTEETPERWTDVVEVTRLLGNLLNWSKTYQIPKVIMYGTEDNFVTPDMLANAQSMMDYNVLDPTIEFRTSNYGHNYLWKDKNMESVIKTFDDMISGTFKPKGFINKV